MDAQHGHAFLLRAFDRLTDAWVRSYSLVSIPALRPRVGATVETHQRNRDIFVASMLIASIVAVAACHWTRPTPGHHPTLHLAAAFALYREVDVFLKVARTGVLFSFRGDLLINQEPLWRTRGILLGVLFNYVGLVM